MIRRHKRLKTDPFFRTLVYTRWATCPGCKQRQSNVFQHKNRCKYMQDQTQPTSPAKRRKSDVSSQLIIDAKPKSGKNSSSSENPEPIQEADQHGGSTVPPRASKSTTNPPNIHGEVPQPRSKPEEWTRSWQCPDCTHKTKRADHLKEHMIGQHMRSKKDPFFSTLSYTRWETCPGCDQAKAKLSQHKKKCPMFLALEAKATVVIEALPSSSTRPENESNVSSEGMQLRSSRSTSKSRRRNMSTNSDEETISLGQAKESPEQTPEEEYGFLECPDCGHRTNRADHLKTHMITQHQRPTNDPFYSTLLHSRWARCPGCRQLKSKISEHRKKCKDYLALTDESTPRRSKSAMASSKNPPDQTGSLGRQHSNSESAPHSFSPKDKAVDSNANKCPSLVGDQEDVNEEEEGPVMLRCPACLYETERRHHLKRHMTTMHDWSKDDPFFRTLYYSQFRTCPDCHEQRKNMTKHRKKECKVLLAAKRNEDKTGQRSKKAKRQEYGDEKFVLEDLKTSSFEDSYKKYLGNVSEATKEVYCRHLSNFFHYYTDIEEVFNPKDLFLTAQKPHGRAVVLKASHLKSFTFGCSTSPSIDVAKALTSFLQMYKGFVEKIPVSEMDERVHQDIMLNTEFAEFIMDNYQTKANSQTHEETVVANKKRAKHENRGMKLDIIRSYCLKFVQSSYVSRICRRVTSNCQQELDKDKFTPQMIRDMVMALLELTCGGLRGIAIRTLTLQEYQDRDLKSQEPFIVTMKCHAHQTGQPSRPTEVTIQSAVVMAFLAQYVEHARINIGNPKYLVEPASPLFPTKQNRPLCNTKIAINWIRNVLIDNLGVKNESDPTLTSLKSSTIRKAFILSRGEEGSSYRKQITSGPIGLDERESDVSSDETQLVMGMCSSPVILDTSANSDDSDQCDHGSSGS